MEKQLKTVRIAVILASVAAFMSLVSMVISLINGKLNTMTIILLSCMLTLFATNLISYISIRKKCKDANRED